MSGCTMGDNRSEQFDLGILLLLKSLAAIQKHWFKIIMDHHLSLILSLFFFKQLLFFLTAL